MTNDDLIGFTWTNERTQRTYSVTGASVTPGYVDLTVICTITRGAELKTCMPASYVRARKQALSKHPAPTA